MASFNLFILVSIGLVVLFGVGGAVFSILERDAELNQIEQNKFLYKQMQSLYEFKYCKDEFFQDMDFCKDQKKFHKVLKEFFARSGNSTVDQSRWTFFGSVFFVITLVTTLGYGNLHPNTPLGLAFTVVFAVIGIPTMAYALSLWGRYAIEGLLYFQLPRKWIKTQPIAMWGSIFVCFLLSGGLLFGLLEGWSPFEAMYFSACTMMTVGFGGLMPTTTLSKILTIMFIACTLGITSTFIASLTQKIETKGEKLILWYGATDAGDATPSQGPTQVM